MQVLPALNYTMPTIKPLSQYIPSGDAIIHCEIAGPNDAPALVFLHGNGEDSHVFDQQIRYFSSNYNVIAIDTRAHGQSTRGTAPFNFHTFATDLIAVLDALRIEKAHIAGFSDGANTAIHVALTAPERIASMVLLGANYNPKGLKSHVRLQLMLMYVWLSIAAPFSIKSRKRKEIWGLMINQPNLTIEGIRQITTKTFVIAGEKDMVTQRHTDEITQAIAGSKRLIIPNGDHFWMFADPDTLNRYVTDFLETL
jgi:pimeloyl-ACP methyl ester carboxylesterase